MRRLILAAAVIAAPAAAQTREAWQPPTLTTTRYDEDWSNLANAPGGETRWTEPFKYIPLDANVYLTTGIEIRARSESYRSPSWGAERDDGYLWLRTMPYADLHAGPMRAFVQPIAAYAIGVAPAAGPIDQTRIDMMQAFADVRLGPVTLRAGRQMLSLGSERLIGTRYGPNVPLAFDGFRALATIGPARVSLIAVRPVTPGPASFDDRRAKTRSLTGIYAAFPGIDLYHLDYRNHAARYAGQIGRERRHSLGARLHGSRHDWRWNIEAVAQFGRFGGQHSRAWTIAVEGGKSWPAAPLAPEATLRLNVVSGDRTAGDRTLGAFNALFPKGKYFGELSPIGPSNIVSANPHVGLSLGNGLSAGFSAMVYWRYAAADGVYAIPGNLIRPAGGSSARFIGKEMEATVAWQATPELELSASLSAFAAGRFLRDTGAARTIGMLCLESNFRF
ncbi:alginate export family protein [Sphingomonas naphthae]|uniref:Alginate export family protein n=1 Tax=Sphingomonas naphthae TaxID=1813468 RepID=A0ABY7TN68_9SPHN|nr:alginate export family protein [Sphingomonas naphthae]WCT74421.1 alginate export family protein [Sphingomonas naphthae]